MPRSGRPPVTQPVVMEALHRLYTPAGVSSAAIAKDTGLDHRQVSSVIHKFLQRGIVFGAFSGRMARAFIVEADRDAATAAWREKLLVPRHVRRREAAATTPKAPKPETFASKITAALHACTDPLGATLDHLRESSGVPLDRVVHATHRLIYRGQAFTVSCKPFSRYFATKEARDSAEPAVLEHVAVLRAEVKRATAQRAQDKRTERLHADDAFRERRRDVNRKSYKKNAKPAKAKPPKAKPIVLAPAKPKTPEQQTRARWAKQEAIVPPSVKVTVCPGFTPRTFAPPPFFRGEFSNEWRQLRGAA